MKSTSAPPYEPPGLAASIRLTAAVARSKSEIRLAYAVRGVSCDPTMHDVSTAARDDFQLCLAFASIVAADPRRMLATTPS